MIRWAIYRPDGRIDRIYDGPADEAALQPVGDEQVTPLAISMDDSTAYVDGFGATQARQAFPLAIDKTTLIADGVDEVVVTGIPAGTTVTWPDGQQDPVTDGEVRLSVDLAGTYTLTFDAIPYLRQEVTLEAVAAT